MLNTPMRNFINEVAQKMEGGFDLAASLKSLLGIEENEIEGIIEKLEIDELSNLIDACMKNDKKSAREIVDSVNVEEKEIPRKKHRKNEEDDDSTSSFNIGDPVIVDMGPKDKKVEEGENPNEKEATIKLPHAPNGTVGVMIDGELKMVKKNKVRAVKEGVLGMTPLPGLNTMQDEPQNDEIRRMKELAGVRDVPGEMPEQSPMVPPSMEEHPDTRLPFHNMDFDGEEDEGEFDTFGGDDYEHHDPVSAATPVLSTPIPMPSETIAPEGDYASVERAITEIEDMIPNIKISEYKSLVARLKALLSMAEGAGRSALAEAAKKKPDGNVFDKHQLAIAKKTLKMNDVGADIMGGMTKTAARAFLKKSGWSSDRIEKLEEGFENGVWVEPNGGGEKDLDSAHGSALFSKRSSEPTQAVEEDDSGESKWQSLFLKGKERGIKTASKMLTFIAKKSGSDQTAVKKWLMSKVKPKADKAVDEETKTKWTKLKTNAVTNHKPKEKLVKKEDTIFPKDEKKKENPRKDSDGDEPSGTRKTLMDYVFEADDDGMQTIGANRNDAVKALKARLGPNATDQQAGAAFDAMLRAGTVKQNGPAFQMPAMGDNAVKQAAAPAPAPAQQGNSMGNGNSNLRTDVNQVNQGPKQMIVPR